MVSPTTPTIRIGKGKTQGEREQRENRGLGNRKTREDKTNGKEV